MGKPIARGRTATIAVRIPTHVPPSLHHLWQTAAQHTENRNGLRSASGRIDYYKINGNYMRLLAGYHRLADKAQNDEDDDDEAEDTPPPKSKKKSASRRNWPFKDITPNDIARFAASGQWDAVAKAAKMASRR
jgi:hypothetical protein